MKTVIYFLAGAIALGSVGCTAGRKERQAKAEPPTGSKAVAKTRTSARAVLATSTKPTETKRPSGSGTAGTKPSASKPTQTVAKKSTVESKEPRVVKEQKRETPSSVGKTSIAKSSSKPSSKADPKSVARKPEASDPGGLNFEAPAVDAVAPLPKSALSGNRLVVPPKLVRVGAETETKRPEVPSSPAASEKTEAPAPESVANTGAKPDREKVQTELNKALADAGSDAKAVVGSMVPTAGGAVSKSAEKSPVVEDDAPSTSDTSNVVKSPATMKGSDPGAPPAVVDSKGDVKEGSSTSPVSVAASSSKGVDAVPESKPSSPEAAVAKTPSAEPPPIEALTSVSPKVPKKTSPVLEKKEAIAAALRDGSDAMRSDETARALELFESVVKQDKDQRDAWFRIGYLREISGDFQGALQAFREVKRILAN